MDIYPLQSVKLYQMRDTLGGGCLLKKGDGLNSKIVLLIPYYNEQETTITRTFANLSELINCLPFLQILIVDDGSDPENSSILQNSYLNFTSKANLQIFRHSPNRGYGGAINAGLKLAKTQGHDWVIIADSELSMRNEDILLMHKAIISNSNSSCVKASRYLLKHGFDQIQGHRKFWSYLGKWISQILTYSLLSDPTTGFRALNLQYVEVEARVENSFASITEELLQVFKICLVHNLWIVQTPYIYQVRKNDDRSTSFSYKPKLLFLYLKFCLYAFAVITLGFLKGKRIKIVNRIN